MKNQKQTHRASVSTGAGLPAVVWLWGQWFRVIRDGVPLMDDDGAHCVVLPDPVDLVLWVDCDASDNLARLAIGNVLANAESEVEAGWDDDAWEQAA